MTHSDLLLVPGIIVRPPATMQFWVLFLLALSGTPPAPAHSIEGMDTQVTIEEDKVTVKFKLAAEDCARAVAGLDLNSDGLLTEFEIELGKLELIAGMTSRFTLTDRGKRVEAAETSFAVTSRTTRGLPGEGLTTIPHELEFTFMYKPQPDSVFRELRIDPNFFKSSAEAPRGSHKNLVTILDRGNPVVLQCTGTETYETTLGSSSPPAREAPSGQQTETATTKDPQAGPAEAAATPARRTSMFSLMRFFLWEGVLHILLGWDHIFFVIGLTLMADNMVKLVKVITAFTVAHSITLIITALDLISVSRPEIVEALIALSIAYVGFENLWRIDRGADWRWMIAFGFGLVHGMGFAGALKENLGSDLPGTAGLLAVCLLVFNLGVEVGQLGILIFLFPSLQALRRHSPRVSRRVIIGGSIAILFMGVSWFIDRAIAPDVLPWIF